jgi:molecular chaperone HscB
VNHFEFFELPISFYLDEKELKKRFLQKSKKYHPDFFATDSEEKQQEVLELSTQINDAYKTLSDFNARMAYILNEKGILGEEGKNEIPQDFLMEVMEIQETIMELEFDFTESAYQNALQLVDSLDDELETEIESILKAYDDAKSNEEELKKVKDFFLKKKYLWRIRENLNRFAPASKEA